DGGAEVGHHRPFGVHLMIRSSKALGRESQGFAAMLTAGQVRAPSEQRQKLEKEIHEKWGQAFQIETIRFHDPATMTARPSSRDGWEQTPVAYLVLRARDPSVDRLPALQIDLPFNDGQGAVLLPITSQTTLIDARESKPAPRPCREIKVKQILDD